MPQNNILLILTGGTICSFEQENGERASDTHKAETLIVQNYRKSYGDGVSFDAHFPLNILSENMTVAHWNRLLDEFRTCDFSAYDGIIVLHGTDTLAYTASLLSLLLAGIPCPLFLVSAQLPLTHKQTNGNENFRAAVELITTGNLRGVYAVYRNSDGVTYLHRGAHLRQCANHSDDFFSADMTPISTVISESTMAKEPLLFRVGKLLPSVLRIEPYVGLDYRHFTLDNVAAVLHGTYHSSTACVAPDESTSLLWFLRQAEQRHIPVFLSPCNEKAYAYETTGEALRNGAIALSRMTPEMTYAKLLVGLSLGFSEEELKKFLKTELCGEFIL